VAACDQRLALGKNGLRRGAAVKARRNALKLTAVDLAERTKALGYPVNRVAISKIEGNLRAGKLDVAELLVLAVALEIPPALLLLPTFPGGAVDVLPRSSASTLRPASGSAETRGATSPRPPVCA
jgi:transcriptional regulator with XRE-family HTH domain